MEVAVEIADNATERPTRKRRHSVGESSSEDNICPSQEEQTRSKKYCDAAAPGAEFTIVKFCDEVLVEIFQYLDSWTLLALKNCCNRFFDVVGDNRLWRYINLIKEPLPIGIIADVLECSNPDTRVIKLRGPSPAQQADAEIQQFNKALHVALSQRCANMCILELHGIAVRNVVIMDMPKTLKRLVFNDCDLRVAGSMKRVFQGIDNHFDALEELGIEKCDWFDPYYLVLFSKIPHLRWLSLMGAQQLIDFIPYGSMATRFGFKTLEYLDIRFTPITDSDLQCFNSVATLKELLLDCPEILRGKKKRSARVVAVDEVPPNANIKSPPSLPADNGEPANATTTTNSQSNSAGATTSQLSTTIKAGEIGSAASEKSTTSTTKTLTTDDIPSTSTKSQTTTDADDMPCTAADSKISKQKAAEPVKVAADNATTKTIVAATTNIRDNEQPSTSAVARARANKDNELSCSSSSSISRNNIITKSINFAAISNESDSIDGDGDGDGDDNGSDPDQVIVLDLRNRRVPIIMNVPAFRQFNRSSEVDTLFNHPNFYELCNPFFMGVCSTQLARTLSDVVSRHPDNDSGGMFNDTSTFRYTTNVRCNPVTDRGICCFGRPPKPVETGVVWIRTCNWPSENNFERLTLRNYKLITDLTLRHLVQCSPFLIYLDVTNTGVTLHSVQSFKDAKPDCRIVANHLKDWNDDLYDPDDDEN